MIEGMVLMFNSWAKVLFDCGSSHFLIALSFASALGLDWESMEKPCSVESPLPWA